jgi:hypothetical protein
METAKKRSPTKPQCMSVSQVDQSHFCTQVISKDQLSGGHFQLNCAPPLTSHRRAMMTILALSGHMTVWAATFSAGTLVGLWASRKTPETHPIQDNRRRIDIWVADSNLTYSPAPIWWRCGPTLGHILEKYVARQLPTKVLKAIRPQSAIAIVGEASPQQTLALPTGSLNLSWESKATLEHLLRFAAAENYTTRVFLLTGQNDCDGRSRTTRPSDDRDILFGQQIKQWLGFFEDMSREHPDLTVNILLPFTLPRRTSRRRTSGQSSS